MVGLVFSQNVIKSVNAVLNQKKGGWMHVGRVFYSGAHIKKSIVIVNACIF